MAQWVKDPVWSLLWLWSQWRHRFDPWPGNVQVRGVGRDKKTKNTFGENTERLEMNPKC